MKIYPYDPVLTYLNESDSMIQSQYLCGGRGDGRQSRSRWETIIMSLLSLMQQPAGHDPRMITLGDLENLDVLSKDGDLGNLTFMITGIPASLRIFGEKWECLKASRLYLENEANIATAGVCPSTYGLEG